MSTTRVTETMFDPGETLLAIYPFTDHSSQKLRPILVVSRKEFNQGTDFVSVPLSSQVRSSDRFAIVLRDSEPWFAQTGLRLSSAVKWTKPMTLTAVVVQRRLGKLPDDVFAEIARKVQSLFAPPD